MNKKYRYLLPIVLSLCTALGMFIGVKFKPPTVASGIVGNHQQKLLEVLKQIDKNYVDSVSIEEVTEEAVQHLLTVLDPYSSYISAQDIAAANESLDGNFQGIGVEFHLVKDTVTVVSPIAGGPSEKVGIRAGDKIVAVDGEAFFGSEINNQKVVARLRGEKNTEVTISVIRKGQKSPLIFTITRDDIPIYSVEASYRIHDSIAYIKITRFGATTMMEFRNALSTLQAEGASSLILDLRGNPGGYLETAKQIANAFLQKSQLIVYTQGKSRKREVYKADGKGLYKEGRLIVLIDEGSASASEIVAGAIQDHDRGIIVGRRSHGKGLVQEPFNLQDQSVIRLTVARYYTPSGRCIQRPYDETAYGSIELMPTFKSLDRTDTSYYQTAMGRWVQAGGGILPDVVVESDTVNYPQILSPLLRNGLLNEFLYSFLDIHREKILSTYSNDDQFIKKYKPFLEVNSQFEVFLESKDFNAYSKLDSDSKQKVMDYLKALLARNIYGDVAYYKLINEKNAAVSKAIEMLKTSQKAFFNSSQNQE